MLSFGVSLLYYSYGASVLYYMDIIAISIGVSLLYHSYGVSLQYCILFYRDISELQAFNSKITQAREMCKLKFV